MFANYVSGREKKGSFALSAVLVRLPNFAGKLVYE